MIMKMILYIFIFLSVQSMLTSCKSTEEKAVEYGSTSFKKTSYRCDKCSCKGYWGYKHGNGTYEGKCSNRDAGGHTCRHSPQQHGLREW